MLGPVLGPPGDEVVRRLSCGLPSSRPVRRGDGEGKAMGSMDHPTAHHDAFERLEGFLRGLSGPELETIVPACPRWSVLDVVRHLTGLAVDCSGDTLPGPEDWDEETMDRRHVDARGAMDLGELLEEWREASPGFEKALGRIDSSMAGLIVGEYACHEHDVRGALRRPGARGSLCVRVATDTYVDRLL
ncbi:MAG TPA: maleylpyruvate isomerase N-terminal domain-containing protein, partial [Acidimicrobiales bacterium]|nr:maleylpyruvate isomerase N-terminal domain-containing protein [Acidimicrobiales bacterium]